MHRYYSSEGVQSVFLPANFDVQLLLQCFGNHTYFLVVCKKFASKFIFHLGSLARIQTCHAVEKIVSCYYLMIGTKSHFTRILAPGSILQQWDPEKVAVETWRRFVTDSSSFPHFFIFLRLHIWILRYATCFVVFEEIVCSKTLE